MNENAHCNAKSGILIFDKLRKKNKLQSIRSTKRKERAHDGIEVLSIPDSDERTNVGQFIDKDIQNAYANLQRSLFTKDNEEDLMALNEKNNNDTNNDNRRKTAPPHTMRITEILAANMKRLHVSSPSSPNCSPPPTVSSSSSEKQKEQFIKQKMEGDIPQLNRQNSFFVEGIKIGWPFTTIMPPQRQMALHLIKAFKASKHVVLESPTGTGKSAAILCTTLAWQRYNSKLHVSQRDASEVYLPSDSPSTKPTTTKIIYCSRTHSQVAQIVASLKKTPYRPRMAVMGSRERMCIHKHVTNSHTKGKRINVNNECRIRVRNTENYRKTMYKSANGWYDDNNPIEDIPGDGGGATSRSNNTGESEVSEELLETDENGEIVRGLKSKKYLTCPHYRRLTSIDLAINAHDTFVPNKNKVNCCSIGGDKSKFGSHDIEDLVAFGKNPDKRRQVAIYRDPNASTTSFGLRLTGPKNAVVPANTYGVTVFGFLPDGATEIEGSLNNGDIITSVSGEDVKGLSLSQVTSKIKNAEDPLLLDVIRGPLGHHNTEDSDGYTKHSACPYYLSREFANTADLIFAPYNYILDPKIREIMNIDLKNSIVILDEAHNVEHTLRSSGSGRFGEIELNELLLFLHSYSSMERRSDNLIDLPRKEHVAVESHDNTSEEDPNKGYLPDVAHSLLLFVEEIINFLIDSKESFKKNLGPNGEKKTIEDIKKYKTVTEREVKYFGPNGNGVGGRAIGCKPFFDMLQFTDKDAERLVILVQGFEKYLMGQITEGERDDTTTGYIDRLSEFVHKICYASNATEHYFISSVVVANNGDFDYAAKSDEDKNNDDTEERATANPRKAKKLPLMQRHRCQHSQCRSRILENSHHGIHCDGSIPHWEVFLNVNLLTPSELMKDLAEHCRSIVLASGSLAPIKSLCAELKLLSPEETNNDGFRPLISSCHSTPGKDDETSNCNDIKDRFRLQTRPKPLEANHVINISKQLLPVSIGNFPDGSVLSVNFKSTSNVLFLRRLGSAIVTIVENIPRGGVLVFFPSYALLKKCVKIWNPGESYGYGNPSYNSQFSMFSQENNSEVWDKLLHSKGKIVIEPTGSQEEFEHARDEYNDTVRSNGSCILLAVYRGKMSEGVSFNDDFARGVICVGVPYPNAFDRTIKAKRAYNDEQRKIRKQNDLLPGSEWYMQQAFRAIAQALGRCIRHAGDYGTIILLDKRHCDDGSPIGSDGVCNAHKNLPNWIRHSVKTLRNTNYSIGGNEIIGGWKGLSKEMKEFFKEAQPYAKDVLLKQEERSKESQKTYTRHGAHTFNIRTGTWTSKGGSESSPLANTQTSSSDTRIFDSNLESQTKQTRFVGKNIAGEASINMMGDSSNLSPARNTQESSSDPRIFCNVESDTNQTYSTDIILCPIPNTKASPINSNLNTKNSTNQPCFADINITEEPSINTMGETSISKRISSSTELEVSSSKTSHENHLCVICEDGTKNIVFVPCHHLCVCIKCFEKHKIISCPMCRKEITSHIKIFN